jgi:ketosteroid isomerase-like protein
MHMSFRNAALALAASAIAACRPEQSPEEEVRAVVAAAEEAAEARDASTLLDFIAADYSDGRGNGAEELRRYVRGYLLAHQSVHLVTRVEEIELPADDLARLRATVGMLGKEAAGESAWDLAAEVYEFEVTLAREDGEWRVTRAEWRPALGN